MSDGDRQEERKFAAKLGAAAAPSVAITNADGDRLGPPLRYAGGGERGADRWFDNAEQSLGPFRIQRGMTINDLSAAMRVAAQMRRPVAVFATKRDCHACQDMKRTLFTDEPFKTWAGQTLVMAEVSMSDESDAGKRQAELYAKKYGEATYTPKLIMIDARGRKLAEFGYRVPEMQSMQQWTQEVMGK